MFPFRRARTVAAPERPGRWAPVVRRDLWLAFASVLAMVLPAIRPAHAAGIFHVNPLNPQSTDSGPGTPEQPYRTISAAVTARGGAGTTILVAPAIYREQVTIKVSGSSASPFVLRATAPGAILDGADDLAAPAQWSLVSGNVWRATTVTWSPVQVLVDGVRLIKSSASTSSLPPQSFRWVSGQGLYVNVGGGNPGSRATFVGRRAHGFRISGRSYIAIEGFGVTRAEDRAIYLSSSANQCTVLGTTVTYGARYGISFSSCTGGRIADNVVTDHRDHGIYSSSSSGITISGNESARNVGAGGAEAHGIALSGATSHRVERNRLHDNSGAGVQIVSSSHNSVSLQNRSWKNATHGFQIKGSTGVGCIGDVAHGNTRRGFSFESSSTGGKVYNVIAANNGISTGHYDLYVDSGSTSNFQSNDNVFWNATAQAPVFFRSTAYAALSAFASATSNDTRSAQADPGFVAPATGDFELTGGSPAIDAANSTVADWPATDAQGRARFDDPSTPNSGLGQVPFGDRGALEHTAVTIRPTAVLELSTLQGLAPLDVRADGSGSGDSDGTVVSYRFDFGDGTIAGPQTEPIALHTFDIGTWIITLRVVDDLGASDTATAIVRVTRENIPPVAALAYSVGPYEAFREMVVDPAAVFLAPALPRPVYLVPGTDPTFGTTLTRIAGNTGAAIAAPGTTGSWGTDARHHYSKDQPWNADGTMISIENSGTPSQLILDGESYAVRSGDCASYNAGDDRWHPTLPNIRVDAKDAVLRWFDVAACNTTRSWVLPFPVDYFGPSEGNTSRDGRFAALTDNRRVFLVDMDPQPPFAPYPAQRIGPAYDFSSCGLPDCALGWVSVSASGKYVVVKYVNDHPRVLDVNPATLELTPRPMPESSPRCSGTAAQGFIYDLAHADLTLNPFDGDEDVLIGQEHCGWRGQTIAGQEIGAVVMARLRDGVVTALTSPANEATAHHVSTRNIARPGWAYVSYRPEPGKRFSDEVVAVKLDGSKEVQRFAHKHALIGSYRSESHAVPSPDGRRVMFASNWSRDCTSCPASTDIKGYVIDARATSAPDTGGFRQRVRVDASASDDVDGSIISYRFEFSDGTSIGPQPWPVVSHVFEAGSHVVKVIVTDDSGAEDSTSTAFLVQRPNRAPNGGIDLPAADATVVVGDRLRFESTATDPDDNGPFAYQWRFGGAAADVTLEDPGEIPLDVLGTFVVTLTAIDAAGLADPAPDTVRVSVVPRPPDRSPVVVAPEPYIVRGDSMVVARVAAADPDGEAIDSLVADLGGLPSGHGATFIPGDGDTAGTFSWRPRSGDARLASYEVIVTAFNARSGSDTLHITVTSPPSVMAPDTVRGPEGAPITIEVQALDPEGDAIIALEADLSSLPVNHGAAFSVAPNHLTGSLTWTPTFTHARVDPYAIVFTASNAFAATDTTWVVVDPVDRPPQVTVPVPAVVLPESSITFDVTSVDPDGEAIDSLTADLSSLPEGHDAAFATTGAAGTFTWRPQASDARAEPWVVRFTAWNAATSTDSMAIFVTHPPLVAAPPTFEATEIETVVVHVTAADPEGDPIDSLSADLSGLPAGHGASFVSDPARTSGTLTWVPTYAHGRAAPYIVTFRARNAGIGTAETAINVANVDRPPLVTAPATASGTEGQPISVAITASDPDGDPIPSLVADVSGLPPGHTATFAPGSGNQSGLFSWTPGGNDGGAPPYVVTFRAVNDLVAVATTSISVADATAPNLVGNPSFETNTSGWSPSGSATLTRVAGGHEGAWTLRAQGPSTSEFGVNDSPNWISSATAGTRYRYRAWVKASTGSGRSRIKLREYRSGTQVGSSVSSPTLTLGADWQMLSVEVVAQQTGNTLDMQVLDQPNASGESFLIDNVSITVVPATSPAVAALASARDSTSALVRVEGAPLAGSIRVSPQPVGNASVLSFSIARPGLLDVRLYDASGREVRTLLQSVNASPGRFTLSITPGDARGNRLAAGVYFLRIRAAEGEEKGRIIVVR